MPFHDQLTDPPPSLAGRIEQQILCVDDDPDFLGSMHLFLPEKINDDRQREYWYQVLFVDNPKEALSVLEDLVQQEKTVAMVISDQKMPQMKGTEFLSEVKKISGDSARVLLTGYAGIESAVEAINKNLLDRYFTKPIDDENDFVLNIQHLLQRFNMKQTIREQDQSLHQLYTFSNVLNSMEDIRRTLDYIVSFTKDLLHCTRVSIMLIEQDALRIKAAAGVPEEVIQATRIPVGERIAGQVFQSREAVLAETLSDFPFLDKTVRSDARSFMSVPILYAGLVSGEQALGVINVTEKKNNAPFTKTDLETMTYIVNTASIAVHNQINRTRLRDAYIEAKANAAALEYQMTHDALTGLPNRTMFYDCLKESLAYSKPTGQPLAVLMFDINRFKEINDTIGHHNGDILLQALTERIQPHIQHPQLLARFGADEFTVLLPESDTYQATMTAHKILEVLQAPFEIESLPLLVNASVGIALSPVHGEDAHLLVQRAEVAMFVAKESGNGHRIYEAEIDPYNTRRLIITGELRQAIENNDLTLYYQPKVDLRNGRVVGVEALSRWVHPKYGFMPPDQFIPLAEQTGLIKPLTLKVLNNALRQCSIWHKDGLEISVAINVSAQTLQDRELVSQVENHLAAWSIPPQWLRLEITESTFMANPALASEILSTFNSRGIRISIDDFGTGHSSLAYLKKLPANELKIDKSFIKEIGTNDSDSRIVQSIIELGHTLGFTVVAEGVETREIYERLAELGCDAVQGYYISRPVPADEFSTWIKNRKPA